MESYGALSLLPPLLAIGLAIKTREVYLSLLAGIFLGWTLLSGWDPTDGLIRGVDAMVAVLADRERTMILMVSILIGAVLTLTQYSGGMAGFIQWVERRGWARTRRSAGLLAWGLGFFIFVESVIGVLVSGTITRPLFDRMKISREKLAYVLDSTCAPKATLLPLNTWGAYLLGLLGEQGLQNPVSTLVTSVPLNFYAILAVGLAFLSVMSDRSFGPMKEAERRVLEEGKLLRDGAEPLAASDSLMIESKQGVTPRALNLVLPIAAVIIALVTGLMVTGNGNIMNGSGTLAAFWAVLSGIAVAGLLYRFQKIMTVNELTEMFMKGVGGLVPVGVLLILAFAIGDVCRELGTGAFVAQAAQAGLPRGVIPAALFVVSGVVAFSTGTSFGTWAIMIPIASPMTSVLSLNPPLAFAAVIGGGIFGDHCSPISDSTIVSSLASGTDHIDHVRTQLPYALVAAAGAILLYLILGFTL